MVAVAPSSESVQKLQETERKLDEKKVTLENFQGEFCEIKKKFEEACKQLETDITETVDLIQERDQAYSDYMDLSGTKYAHVQPTRQQNGNGNKGLLGGIGKLFG